MASMPSLARSAPLSAAIALLLTLNAGAGDWPTFRGDNQRSGVTVDQLSWPLTQTWIHRPAQAPRPAWPRPAKRDFCHAIQKLSPSTAFDRAFNVAVADGLVYYGSSSDDAVHCISAADGLERWRFYTEGPVRLAPSVQDGKVFAGSDDGWVYCLSAKSGALVWKYRAGPGERRIPGNGRMISVWPVRSSVVVEGGIAYFAAGLFPRCGVYLCALEAETGRELWKNPVEISAQGYLMASPTRLFLPTGRTAPMAFERSKGVSIGGVRGFDKRDVGGCFALVLKDVLVHGPSESGNVHISAMASREKIVSTPGTRLVAKGDMVYILGEEGLRALNTAQYIASSASIEKALKTPKKERDEAFNAQLASLQQERKASGLWRVSRQGGYALIMAGDALLVGGEGDVTAYRVSDGEVLWSESVDGRAWGFAVAGGALYVSTDTGAIHCFNPASAQRNVGEGLASSRPAQTPFSGESSRLYAAAADQIIAQTGIQKGYCLVLDSGEGNLAYALAKRTDLTIVALESEPQKAAQARKVLGRAGLPGSRVSVHQVTSSRLPYPDGFANLVVSDAAVTSGVLPAMGTEIARVLRPFGGAVCVGQPGNLLGGRGQLDESSLARWQKTLCSHDEGTKEFAWRVATDDGLWGILRRGATPGAGAWTHQYADPGNTACSGDMIANGAMDVQWFGDPGPREMIDRHIRTVSPLSKGGRLYVPADNHLIAVDAYNGTPLWSVDIPYSRRVAIHLDSGSMALGGDRLYVVAGEQCLVLDTGTGRSIQRLDVPQHLPGELSQWGYLAVSDDRIVGSGNEQGSARDRVGHKADRESRYGDPKTSVTSRYLFALDRATGREEWHYQSGVIWNPCIAVGDGMVYFLESRHAPTTENPGVHMKPGDLTGNADCYLVALDLTSGEKQWEQAVDVNKCEYVVFLSYSDETLVVSGSGLKEGDDHAWYYVYGFAAQDGRPLWAGSHRNNKRGRIDHGKDVHHPAIVNGVVYAEPAGYDLKTGVRVAGLEFPRGGHSCGTISASSGSLYYRGGNPQVFDLGQSKLTALNDVTRPGCWINMIPASGLVLVPEASSGCVCAYSLQTSIAYAPQTR